MDYRLSAKEILELEQLFLAKYKEAHYPSEQLAVLWFQVVMTFLSYRGFKVQAPDISKME